MTTRTNTTPSLNAAYLALDDEILALQSMHRLVSDAFDKFEDTSQAAAPTRTLVVKTSDRDAFEFGLEHLGKMIADLHKRYSDQMGARHG